MVFRRGAHDEEASNADAIASLAQQIHQPLPTVKRVYDAEYARLKADARVTDYLVLFASRKARDVLLAPNIASSDSP